MRFLLFTLLGLGLLIGVPVLSHAQQGDVNATIPGEGYQGWPGIYGGKKILQWCWFNRFLGEPYTSKTMYFEFKACAKDNHPMTGDISWGDGAATHLERVICGAWRVPHIYQSSGDFSANIKIENESCQGTAAPTTITPPQGCWPPFVCTCNANSCSEADRCEDTASFSPNFNENVYIKPTDVGVPYVDGLPENQWHDKNPGKTLLDANSIILKHFTPSPLDIPCTINRGSRASIQSSLFASTSPQGSNRNDSLNNLALASSATPIQENYPLLIGAGAVLLAAVLGIAYIVRKLD